MSTSVAERAFLFFHKIEFFDPGNVGNSIEEVAYRTLALTQARKVQKVQSAENHSLEKNIFPIIAGEKRA